MSSALSSELLTRFCEYIEEGLSGRAAAACLKLSAATGARWQRKWRKTGAIAPEVQGPIMAKSTVVLIYFKTLCPIYTGCLRTIPFLVV